MRIAYLSTDPGIAYGGTKGASVHLGEMAAAMAGEGAEVLLLVARMERGAPAPPPGVTVQRLPGPAKGASAAERVSAEPDRQVWLEERLERFGAAALYERLALHSAAGSAAASRLGIPHLVELNAPLLQEAARYRTLAEPEVAELLERAVLRRADLVLAVSGPLARYARTRGARRVVGLPERGGRRPVRAAARSLGRPAVGGVHGHPASLARRRDAGRRVAHARPGRAAADGRGRRAGAQESSRKRAPA